MEDYELRGLIARIYDRQTVILEATAQQHKELEILNNAISDLKSKPVGGYAEAPVPTVETEPQPEPEELPKEENVTQTENDPEPEPKSEPPVKIPRKKRENLMTVEVFIEKHIPKTSRIKDVLLHKPIPALNLSSFNFVHSVDEYRFKVFAGRIPGIGTKKILRLWEEFVTLREKVLTL